jgi:predicted nucleic acid-binding Zn finger protein
MTTSSNCIDPALVQQALEVRLDRAQEFIDEGRVHPVANMPDHYVVEGENAWFVVNGECCCEDFQYRQPLHGGYCKHRLAVALYRKQVMAEITPMPEADKLSDLYR